MSTVRYAIVRRLALGALAATLAAACGPIQSRVGRAFDAEQLEKKLQVGSSMEADVRSVLGEPFGRGKSMMPYHDSPRAMWTYFHDQAVVDIGSGKMDSRRQYLFVFFLNDRFDSYMWFNAELR
jgi:hypothetical protein